MATVLLSCPVGADVELISSDLLRAGQTADEVAALFDLETILDPRLRDQRFILLPALGDRINHHEGIRGSETGGALTFVVSAWIKMPFESPSAVRFCAPSGGITRLREDDFSRKREVVRLGDTRHLDA